MKLPLKPLLTFSAVLVTSLLATSIINSPSASAAASTCTWDGGDVANNNMSDADNWDGCQGDHTVPTTGDTLVFPAGPTDKTITNDLTAGTSFAGITFSGGGYTVSGAAITLTGPVTQTVSSSNSLNIAITLANPVTIAVPGSNLQMNGSINLGSNTLTVNVNATGLVNFQGVISGSGGITKTGTGSMTLNGANTYNGVTTVSDGYLRASNAQALGSTVGNTVVATDARLIFGVNDTFAENLVLNGSVGVEVYELGVLTLNGTITLNASQVFIAFETSLTSNVIINGLISGSGGLDLLASFGIHQTLTLTADNTYTGSTITSFDNMTVVIEGNQSGPFVIYDNTILKGNGSVGFLSIQNTARLAPGASPGCMNTGDLSFVSGSFYDVEIAGNTVCTQYDRTTVTGTVTLGGATLNTLFLSSFAPTVGNTFTIIDNDDSDAVTDTFAGLVEGATFKVGGTIFKISYVGGTGNDVVLTTMDPSTPITAGPGAGTTATPTAPATGLGFITANPLVTLAISVAAAGTIAITARRMKLAQAAQR